MADEEKPNDVFGGIPDHMNGCGTIARVWDGESLDNPVFVYSWTQNPAWIALESILRHCDAGAIGVADINLAAIKSAADYCEELCDDVTYPANVYQNGELVDMAVYMRDKIYRAKLIRRDDERTPEDD